MKADPLPHSLHHPLTSRRAPVSLLIGLACTTGCAGGVRVVPADAVIVEAPAPGPARGRTATGPVEAWVVLAMPGALSMPARDAAERQANQALIESRQSALVQELAALGAKERGRQTLTRSAVLVEVDAAMLDRIAAMPGVAQVRRVTHLHSTDGAGAAPRIGAPPASR